MKWKWKESDSFFVLVQGNEIIPMRTSQVFENDPFPSNLVNLSTELCQNGCQILILLFAAGQRDT